MPPGRLGENLIDTIYFEEDVKDHPRTQAILSKFKEARHLPIGRYGELFNKRNQNFRLQKSNPALILAKKHGSLVLPTPNNFGIGSQNNYYFSHMYNCIYDCRYCFLQGMYSSANYVLFVNFENFSNRIIDLIETNPSSGITFFSGYDCDSLAFEKVTGFVSYILPTFQNHPTALLELRTKSTQIEPLNSIHPIENCVVAYSLMPELMSKALDNKAPAVRRRIDAMKSLANKGWKIGFRLDPLIHGKGWKTLYGDLIKELFKSIPSKSIHSISYGPLRFPKSMFKNIFNLHPTDKLFGGPLVQRKDIVAYTTEIESEMSDYIRKIFECYGTDNIIFECTPEAQYSRSEN